MARHHHRPAPVLTSTAPSPSSLPSPTTASSDDAAIKTMVHVSEAWKLIPVAPGSVSSVARCLRTRLLPRAFTAEPRCYTPARLQQTAACRPSRCLTILDGDSRILGPWSTEPSRIHIELQDGLDRNLTKVESLLVDLRLALSQALKERRAKLRLSQRALAERIKSSQSRIAKIEAADPEVSFDLLLRGFIATGATRQDVAAVFDLPPPATRRKTRQRRPTSSQRSGSRKLMSAG